MFLLVFECKIMSYCIEGLVFFGILCGKISLYSVKSCMHKSLSPLIFLCLSVSLSEGKGEKTPVVTGISVYRDRYLCLSRQTLVFITTDTCVYHDKH